MIATVGSAHQIKKYFDFCGCTAVAGTGEYSFAHSLIKAHTAPFIFANASRQFFTV